MYLLSALSVMLNSCWKGEESHKRDAGAVQLYFIMRANLLGVIKLLFSFLTQHRLPDCIAHCDSKVTTTCFLRLLPFAKRMDWGRGWREGSVSRILPLMWKGLDNKALKLGDAKSSGSSWTNCHWQWFRSCSRSLSRIVNFVIFYTDPMWRFVWKWNDHYSMSMTSGSEPFSGCSVFTATCINSSFCLWSLIVGHDWLYHCTR